MHGAKDVENETMITVAIDAKSKASIQRELHRVDINEFSIYYDLDHLSKEIKRSWGL
jgi:hypothetical protein